MGKLELTQILQHMERLAFGENCRKQSKHWFGGTCIKSPEAEAGDSLSWGQPELLLA